MVAEFILLASRGEFCARIGLAPSGGGGWGCVGGEREADEEGVSTIVCLFVCDTFRNVVWFGGARPRGRATHAIRECRFQCRTNF